MPYWDVTLLRLRLTSALVAGMFLCWFPASAWGTQLWVNGDFEGGTHLDVTLPGDILPNGWQIQAAIPSLVQVVTANTGLYAGFPDPDGGLSYLAFRSPAIGVGGQDCLFEDIPTIPGQSYNISFWVAIVGPTAVNTVLAPEWDALGTNDVFLSNAYYSLPSTAEPFKQFTFTETATLSTTRVFFHGTSATGAILLDDIVMSSIPVSEPSSSWLIGSGLIAIALLGKVCVTHPRKPQCPVQDTQSTGG